jgi:hypothetical protein
VTKEKSKLLTDIFPFFKENLVVVFNAVGLRGIPFDV